MMGDSFGMLGDLTEGILGILVSVFNYMTCTYFNALMSSFLKVFWNC